MTLRGEERPLFKTNYFFQLYWRKRREKILNYFNLTRRSFEAKILIKKQSFRGVL